ncbi:MAG: transposase [Elusimicrobia bacterium]|nr:transposase [Elusimicrobiota bacterium]
MARGVDGREVFVDDDDRLLFLSVLAEVHRQLPFQLFAYCLMGNHFHLAIRTPSTPLSRIMHRILTKYSLTFNARHDREGHLFQARYKAFLCTDELYLARLVKYIHENPVRAGLRSTAADWPWSSLNPQPWLVENGLLPESVRGHWPVEPESCLSNQDFEPWPSLDAEIPPDLLRTEDRPSASMDEIVRNVSGRYGIEPGEVLSGSRRRPVSQVRRAISLSASRLGHRPTDIARHLKVSLTIVSRALTQQVK